LGGIGLLRVFCVCPNGPGMKKIATRGGGRIKSKTTIRGKWRIKFQLDNAHPTEKGGDNIPKRRQPKRGMGKKRWIKEAKEFNTEGDTLLSIKATTRNRTASSGEEGIAHKRRGGRVFGRKTSLGGEKKSGYWSSKTR